MSEPVDKINRMDSAAWVAVAALWLVMLAAAVTLALSLGIWNLIEAF